MSGKNERFLVFIGSYASASDPGIYAYALDASSGALTLLETVSGFKNPSFLDIDHQNKRLYAVAETAAEGQEPRATAVAFAFDPQTVRLTELNQQLSVGPANCHIQFNAAGRYAVASSYSGGQIGLFQVAQDGQLGELSDAHRHEGTGARPDRQDRPHPHSAYTDLENRFVYVPDLGIDRIKIYQPDLEGGKLIPIGEAKSRPGSGPRHMTFHRSKPYVYVINELDGTISVYKRDSESGMLEEIQSISTLPESFAGENKCAEIQLSPNGKFLYGSNRGHDSIAVYAVDELSGRLTLVEIVSSMGKVPRNFDITPDGQFLLAAHQDSHNLVVFRIDQQSGKLQDTGHRAEAAKGVCVRFWRQS